jgi:hypothetical protein
MLAALKATAGLVRHFDAISAMHAHAHLGGVGFFLMLIVGVSYKLVPMFTLSDLQSKRRASWSVRLINLGLAAAFLAILTRSALKPVATVVILAGLAVYGLEMRAILRARKRRVLDWGLKYFISALSLLFVQSALALVLSWPGLPLTRLTGQLENLYGFLALLGVVAFAILGMLYKILPFLAWYASYSGEIGRRKVPALADLYSPRLQVAGYVTYVGGLLATSVAIVLGSTKAMPWSCGLLALSLGIFVVNAALILRHFIWPKLEPLAVKPKSEVRVPKCEASAQNTVATPRSLNLQTP